VAGGSGTITAPVTAANGTTDPSGSPRTKKPAAQMDDPQAAARKAMAAARRRSAALR
jgi:hypothetical protein